VKQIDAGLPVYRVRRLTEAVNAQTSSARFASALLAAFSAGAVLLVAVGLYGLLAYVVSLSRREIAIRLALGADRTNVAALIVRNGLLVVFVGVMIGVGGAFLAGRAIETQLFDTQLADPAIFAVVAGVLLAVTFAASAIPTRRAMRVDPHTALKME
jgi:ABC-type antimicrobial peptide transport system permease subunit